MGIIGTVDGWAFFAGAALGTVVSPALIAFVYGQEFAEACGPIAAMIWMPVFAAIGGHHRYSLVAYGRQADHLIAMSGGCAVPVMACLAYGLELTPMLAAWILIFCEAVTYVLADFLLRRRIEKLRRARDVARPCVVAAAALAMVLFVDPSSLATRVVLASGTLVIGFAALEPDRKSKVVNAIRNPR